MIERIILLSGPISCGKSTLAKSLAERFNMSILKTGDILQDKVREDLISNRIALQNKGDELDRNTRGRWVLEELSRSRHNNNAVTIVDSVRKEEQITAIREAYGRSVVHIHLTAPVGELEKRYKTRKEPISSYQEVRKNKTELNIEDLSKIADIVIDTKRCTKEDVLVRVASRLRVCHTRGSGFVDVVIGGQYGSEGKGQIVAYLANEYDMLIRVGGPNAGHKVFEEPPYTHHQLPSGTRKSEARLLIGPGATIKVDQLLQEIADCKVEAGRLCIDENAMIISEEDCINEANLVSTIGSTGQGVGAAMARRIRERNTSTILAKDVPSLRPYVGKTLEEIAAAYLKGERVLLEGTQGTALSLYHGYYPYVTSRDTTVSGCLAEAGIPPSRVRRVIVVFRTYPIRVKSPAGSTSGPMAQEIPLTEIARRSKKNLDEIRKTEMTSTTYKQRRIGEFEWELLRASTLLNGPTDIALTFTDYLSKDNEKAKRFEQLDSETINFVQEIECVTGARVSLISTGFNPRSIIDRRSW